MKASSRSVKQLFQTDVRFLVPMYQRPYVWSLERQWRPLLEDIIHVAERFLSEEGRSVESNQTPEERTPRHFLGAVVVDQIGSGVGSVDLRLVIDGQQRMTTLQLLLSAIRSVANELGETRSAAQLARLIGNGDEVVDPAHPEERWKVWPTNADRTSFVEAMEGREIGGESRFSQAIEYFQVTIAGWLGDGGPGDHATRLRVLASIVQSHFEVVAVELEPGDNAQVIFETLNDRGEPLLAADLVKNYIFQNLAPDVDCDLLYDRHWRRFDQREWRTETRQGRLRRPRIDVFLQHWLTLQVLDDVVSSELFNAFKLLHLTGSRTAEQLLSDLSADSRTFEALDEVMVQQPESVEGTFVYRWRVLELSAFTPLVMLLFRDEVEQEDRRTGLLALESWMVRRTLCRSTTKDINRFAIDLVTHLSRSDSPPGEQLRRELDEAVAESRRWPSDNEVRASLAGQRAYGRIAQNRLAMVLEAVESELRSRRHVEQPTPRGSGLEIEHIMPQEWSTYWRMPGMTEAGAFRRDDAVQELGNLTLVTGKLNKLLRNHPWLEEDAESRDVAVPRKGGTRGKQNALKEHSLLLLNRDLGEPDLVEWTESRIAERTARLTETILSIWPRPVEDDLASAPWDPPRPEAAFVSAPARRSELPNKSGGRRDLSRISDGTEVWFRRRAAVVAGGALLLDGEEYRTPSAAGAAVTHGIQVNGWLVWRTSDGKSLADLYEEL